MENRFTLNKDGYKNRKNKIREHVVVFSFLTCATILVCLFVSYYQNKLFGDRNDFHPLRFYLIPFVGSVYLFIRAFLDFTKELGYLQRLVVDITELNGRLVISVENARFFSSGILSFEKETLSLDQHFKLKNQYLKGVGDICNITYNDADKFLIIYKFMHNPEGLRMMLEDYVEK